MTLAQQGEQNLLVNATSKKKRLLIELDQEPFGFRSLAVTYSRTRRPRTTIGAEQFHFRVRDGIGWFPLAIAARQTGFRITTYRDPQIQKVDIALSCVSATHPSLQTTWGYMVKSHEQLVLVSLSHC